MCSMHAPYYGFHYATVKDLVAGHRTHPDTSRIESPAARGDDTSPGRRSQDSEDRVSGIFAPGFRCAPLLRRRIQGRRRVWAHIMRRPNGSPLGWSQRAKAPAFRLHRVQKMLNPAAFQSSKNRFRPMSVSGC